MGKKQRERKQQKLEQKQRGRAPMPYLLGEDVSAQARAMVERLANAPALNEKKMIRVLMDSAEILQEPEFQDFLFPLERTRVVRDRILYANEMTLRRALVKTTEQAQQVYDDIRIQIIDELATREFRRELIARFDKYLARVMRGTDTRQIETALLFRPFLEQRELTWGIFGLVTALYEESSRRAGADETVVDPRVQAITDTLGVGDDPKELLAILSDPDKMDEAKAIIEAHPEVFAHADGAADEALDEFEAAVWAGEVELDLFHDAEILLALKRMAEIAQRIPNAERARGEVHAAIQNLIGEIVTPERLRDIQRAMQTAIDAWLEFNAKDAVTLQLELGYLDQETHNENPFLLATFLGQLHRRGAEWFENDEEEEEEEEEESLSILAQPKQSGVLDKIGNLFRPKR